jgi:hypothetical protein
MPDRNKLKLVLGNQPKDLRNVRLPGLDKPFEKLTVSELVQLRPGSDVADSYGVNAVTDNVSVETSSMLEELGRIHKIRNMQTVLHQSRLNDIRGQLGQGGLIGARDASQPSDEESVSLPSPTDDVFSTDDEDPFKA